MRGFHPSEFKTRARNAQNEMAREGIDALLLTTEAEVRYFTGFLTRFWESPTRPWFWCCRNLVNLLRLFRLLGPI